MIRASYSEYVLLALALLSIFATPPAWATSPQDQSPLLGTWAVEPLPGDRSAQALQCRTLAEIEFREKSIRIEPRKAGAASDDDSEMSIAAGLMGVFQQQIGQTGSKISRSVYERDGDNWFITLRDFDGETLVLQTRSTNELLLQDPRCVLRRSTNVSGEAAATPTASPVITTKTSTKPVNLEKIIAGFGVITLGDLRQTLKQKQANIVFDGAARSPYSFSLVTRGMPGMPASEFPVMSYSFDAAGRLRAFSGKRQIAEETQKVVVKGAAANSFSSLVKDYSTRYQLLRHVSSVDRKQTSSNARRFGGPETEMAEFEGPTVKVMLTRIDGVLNETFSHKFELGAGTTDSVTNKR